MKKRRSPSDLEASAGFLSGLTKQARLAWRLWQDSRVPGWVKLVPVAGLVYLLSPIDFIPDLMLPGLGEVDDVVMLLLALKVFVDLSPPGIVREHLEDLFGKPRKSRSDEQQYIDAPYRVLDPNEKESKE